MIIGVDGPAVDKSCAFNMVNHRTTRNDDYGFSMIEMIMVIAIMLVLAAITMPTMVNTLSDLHLRSSATNLSGLLQTARMQAVRKNASYGIQPVTLPGGQSAYFVNLNGPTYSNGDPLVVLGDQVVASQGTGSGAPNEAAFIAGLGFTVALGGVVPSFNARGLPCSPTLANTCPQNPGQGFVLFLQQSTFLGDIRWAAVTVNGSGRVQVWTCDSNGNWIQR
jgi:prepilin-type N-terminal cleavage/methylation domain-containing protein